MEDFTRHHKKNRRQTHIFGKEISRREMGLFFLGIGFALFLINLVTLINMIPVLPQIYEVFYFSLMWYFLSVLSSIFLIMYSLYTINLKYD